MNTHSTILISKDESLPDLDEPYHQRFIQSVLTGLHEPYASVSVSIITDDAMRTLNHTYRGIDRTTDVLSFSMREGETGGDQNTLGDIVISFDRALLQAQQFQHPLRDEINELLFHGLLHLTGLDHEKDELTWRLIETQCIQHLQESNAPYLPKGMCGLLTESVPEIQ